MDGFLANQMATRLDAGMDIVHLLPDHIDEIFRERFTRENRWKGLTMVFKSNGKLWTTCVQQVVVWKRTLHPDDRFPTLPVRGLGREWVVAE